MIRFGRPLSCCQVLPCRLPDPGGIVAAQLPRLFAEAFDQLHHLATPVVEAVADPGRQLLSRLADLIAGFEDALAAATAGDEAVLVGVVQHRGLLPLT